MYQNTICPIEKNTPPNRLNNWQDFIDASHKSTSDKKTPSNKNS